MCQDEYICANVFFFLLLFSFFKSIYVFFSFAMFGCGYTVQFGALLFLVNAGAKLVFGFKGLLVEGEHLQRARTHSKVSTIRSFDTDCVIDYI